MEGRGRDEVERLVVELFVRVLTMEIAGIEREKLRPILWKMDFVPALKLYLLE